MQTAVHVRLGLDAGRAVAVGAIARQENHAGIITFSMLFAVLFGGVYYAIVDLRRTPRSREECAASGRKGDRRA